MIAFKLNVICNQILTKINADSINQLCNSECENFCWTKATKIHVALPPFSLSLLACSYHFLGMGKWSFHSYLSAFDGLRHQFCKYFWCFLKACKYFIHTYISYYQQISQQILYNIKLHRYRLSSNSLISLHYLLWDRS